MKEHSNKKDKLERFVRDNRDEFDDLFPSDSLWNRIDEKLLADTSSKKNLFETKRFLQENMIWKFAAMIVFVLGVGFLLIFQNMDMFSGESQISQNEVEQVGGDIKKYKETISEKRDEIIKLAQHNPSLYKNFASDLEKLTQNYAQLKSEFPTAPNKEVLVEAMMQNLQYQVELLNQQLEILEQFKYLNKKNETDQTTTI